MLHSCMVDPAGEFGGAAAWWAGLIAAMDLLRGLRALAGWLGDRYGLRLAMAVGALLFLATSVLIGLVTAPGNLSCTSAFS